MLKHLAITTAILTSTTLASAQDYTVYQAAPDVVETDLSAFEAYLNDMATLKADFSQASDTGAIHTGTLHLSRPWKMRLNYNPPSPLLIVADGEWLITYDKELDETNYVSLDNTPAEFILRPHIDFGEDVKVISVIPQQNDTTAITLVKTDNSDDGQITLVFNNNPISLREWTVTDPQGNRTNVVLSNLRLNKPMSNSLFRFNKPNLAEQLF